MPWNVKLDPHETPVVRVNLLAAFVSSSSLAGHVAFLALPRLQSPVTDHASACDPGRAEEKEEGASRFWHGPARSTGPRYNNGGGNETLDQYFVLPVLYTSSDHVDVITCASMSEIKFQTEPGLESRNLKNRSLGTYGNDSAARRDVGCRGLGVRSQTVRIHRVRVSVNLRHRNHQEFILHQGTRVPGLCACPRPHAIRMG